MSTSRQDLAPSMNGSTASSDEPPSDPAATTTASGPSSSLQRRHALSLREHMKDMSINGQSRRRSGPSSTNHHDAAARSATSSSSGAQSPLYAPTLPSPLSLYQHSEDSDHDEDTKARRAEPDEYPFPATPSWDSNNVKTPMPLPEPATPSPCSTSVAGVTPQSAPTSPSSPPFAPGSNAKDAQPRRHRTLPSTRSRSIHSEAPLLDQQRMYAALAKREAHHRAPSTAGKTDSSPLTPPESLSAYDSALWQQKLQWSRELATSSQVMFNMDNLSARNSVHSSSGRPSPALPSISRTPELTHAVPESTQANDIQEQDDPVLMTGRGASHFGSAARDHLSEAMFKLLDSLPVALQDQVINIVEYGAMHSRSSSMASRFISHMAQSTASFHVHHVDAPHVDFRPLALELESSSESYLSAKWASTHTPPLTDRIYSSTIARPLSSKVLPPSSVSLGFSVLALQWPFMDRKLRQASASLAHAELMAFLAARAHEFKEGGLLGLAYISRPEQRDSTMSLSKPVKPPLHPRHHTDEDARGNSSAHESSSSDIEHAARSRSASVPAVPLAREDIWSVLTGILSKAIQRLVSTGLLKSAVARQLLALPIHPRTPRQTNAVLSAMSHSWSVEHDTTISIMHPAWVGLAHQTVSASSYTEQTVSLLKVFWEAEARSILRESLGSKAASEYVLESLFDVAREKVEETGPQPLELDVQVLVLRRCAS